MSKKEREGILNLLKSIEDALANPACDLDSVIEITKDARTRLKKLVQLDEIEAALDRLGTAPTTVHARQIALELKSLIERKKRAGDQEEQRKVAAYAEFGNWARHYSTVRMTVATFSIPIVIGFLMALTPSPGSDPKPTQETILDNGQAKTVWLKVESSKPPRELAWAPMVLSILMMVVFVRYSSQARKRMADQMDAIDKSAPETEKVSLGIVCVVAAGFCAYSAWLLYGTTYALALAGAAGAIVTAAIVAHWFMYVAGAVAGFGCLEVVLQHAWWWNAVLALAGIIVARLTGVHAPKILHRIEKMRRKLGRKFAATLRR